MKKRLITEKIEKELMVLSTNLKREIKKISTNQNSIEVVFHNGSSFIACVAGEQSRGLRSTHLIVDEFRLVDKGVLDAILSPTEIMRPTPYTMKKEYEHLKEEPREIFLSSAYWKNHWMWDLIKKATVDMYKGNAILLASDYALTVKHNIRSKAQMRKEKQKMDATTYQMEYLNFMLGGSENQYYTFDLVSKAQTIKKAWFPKPLEAFADNKRTWFGDIKEQDGEIRVVSVDLALSATTKKTKNDLTVVKCIRALPQGERYDRQEVFTMTMEGTDIDTQAIKIRQILEDFRGSYLVFDARTYGTNLVDSMAKVLYDPERDIEYPPLCCFNNDDLKARCKNSNAIPIMWAFIGSAQSNHDMHTAMLGSLMDKKYKMLISAVTCKEEYLMDKKEYKNATMEQKADYELPYVMSDLTLNEMVNLNREFVQGGKIKLVEPSNGLKDKYVTSAMANLFIQELETKLTDKEQESNLGSLMMFNKPKTRRTRLW